MAPKGKAAKKFGNPSSPSTREKEQTAPDWPPIHSLVPASDLSFDTLLPDQILTIPNFWTSSLCKSYTSFLATLPLITTPGQPKRGEATRVNDRYSVDDARFAENLWSGTALKNLITQPVISGETLDEKAKQALWGGEVVGLNSNIRIYRYTKGQFFDQHCKSVSSSSHVITLSV